MGAIKSSVSADLDRVVRVNITKVLSSDCQESSTINRSGIWCVRCNHSPNLKEDSICVEESIIFMPDLSVKLAAVCSSENGDEGFGIVID